jgi:tRNA_anti-like
LESGFFLTSVLCDFPTGSEISLSSFRKGDSVRIIGVGKGDFLGSPHLEQCKMANGPHNDPPAGTQPLASKTTTAEPVVRETEDGKPIWEHHLWDAYRANPVAADRRYLDKLVELTVRGRIEKVGDYCIVGSTMMCVVQGDKSLDLLAKAPPGQSAFRIRGRCCGTLGDADAPGGFYNPMVDCEVLQILKWDGKEWR